MRSWHVFVLVPVMLGTIACSKPGPVEPPPDQPPPPAECHATGCSGQICSAEDVVSTCEFRPEYACYNSATCTQQADGQCGWTMTAELEACLANPPGEADAPAAEAGDADPEPLGEAAPE